MSFSYSGDPSASALDKYRFIIGDNDALDPIMQDAEINYLIGMYPVEDELLFQLYDRAATILARNIKHSLGPESEDPTSRLDFYKKKAASYSAKLRSSGISLPKYAYPKVFGKGMQNNPPWPVDRGL